MGGGSPLEGQDTGRLTVDEAEDDAGGTVRQQRVLLRLLQLGTWGTRGTTSGVRAECLAGHIGTWLERPYSPGLSNPKQGIETTRRAPPYVHGPSGLEIYRNKPRKHHGNPNSLISDDMPLLGICSGARSAGVLSASVTR